MHKERWSGLIPWPQRLTAAPSRLEEIGVSAEKFYGDTKNSIRNVMDMNSNLGGFAIALNDKDVWVMNVAPVKMCEAFSTYPRTYDLLHAWAVFSEIEEHGCSAEDLLIEIIRILRPNGFVIV
ncbi:hypothetical protein DITRI_Ditri09bG0019300 [Diplodiscus trichospermus]